MMFGSLALFALRLLLVLLCAASTFFATIRGGGVFYMAAAATLIAVLGLFMPRLSWVALVLLGSAQLYDLTLPSNPFH